MVVKCEDAVLVEEVEDLIETNYCNGNNDVVKILNQSVLYVLEEIVFMVLDNAVTSVFVETVIKIKVILIYSNVLFVDHEITIEIVCIFSYINDVLCYIKKLNFSGKVNDDDYESSR